MDEEELRRVGEEMEELLKDYQWPRPRPRPPPELITNRVVGDKSNGDDVKMNDNNEGDNLKAEDDANAIKVEKWKGEEEKIVKGVEKVHIHNPRCPKCGSR